MIRVENYISNSLIMGQKMLAWFLLSVSRCVSLSLSLSSVKFFSIHNSCAQIIVNNILCYPNGIKYINNIIKYI
jgi:hypothetical protein